MRTAPRGQMVWGLATIVIKVVVAMVFMVPVAGLHLPAAIVMIVVRVVPVAAGIGWAIPASGYPGVAIATPIPVSVDPGVAGTRRGRRSLVTKGRRGSADVDADLPEGGRGERACEEGCGK